MMLLKRKKNKESCLGSSLHPNTEDQALLWPRDRTPRYEYVAIKMKRNNKCNIVTVFKGERRTQIQMTLSREIDFCCFDESVSNRSEKTQNPKGSSLLWLWIASQSTEGYESFDREYYLRRQRRHAQQLLRFYKRRHWMKHYLLSCMLSDEGSLNQTLNVLLVTIYESFLQKFSDLLWDSAHFHTVLFPQCRVNETLERLWWPAANIQGVSRNQDDREPAW